ncbi:MAG: hypothetical protein KBB88_01470 [Candidatus Pacebacteria bacterium]|nr:hypothetical protein [Candidatus Paceibacterota bacterium]
MENKPEKHFDSDYWNKIQKYVDTYTAEAVKEIAKYKVSTFSNDSIHKAAILSVIKELKLNFSENYIMGMLSKLSANNKAKDLGLTDVEYTNPNIRKAKKSGQTDLFIDDK